MLVQMATIRGPEAIKLSCNKAHLSNSPPNANAKWSEEEMFLIIEKLQEMSDGNTCNNGFKGSTWQAVADMLDDDLKNWSACESKFMRIKAEFKQVKFLNDSSRFGWDEERKVATAEVGV